MGNIRMTQKQKYDLAEAIRWTSMFVMCAGAVTNFVWAMPYIGLAFKFVYDAVGLASIGGIAIIGGLALFHFGEWIAPFEGPTQ